MTNSNIAIIVVLFVILILAVFIGRTFIVPSQTALGPTTTPSPVAINNVSTTPTPITTSPSDTISPAMTVTPTFTPSSGNVGVGVYDVRATYDPTAMTFTPRDITVPVGSTVTFVNPGNTDLSVSSTDNPAFAGLNTGPIVSGGIFVVQFNQKGTFHYTTNQNTSVVGTIVVE